MFSIFIMKRILTGDKVIVIAGKFKWKESIVTWVDWDKIFLEWINIAKKAKKWVWFIDKHLPIHVSNIAILDPKNNKPTRIKFTTLNWVKKRICVSSEAVL